MTGGAQSVATGGRPALEDLGFQTKEQLRARHYELSAEDDVLYWFSSSGSTGDPVVYPWTAADQRVADQTVRRAHAGLEPMPGATAFVIAPTGLPGMWHHMDRQLHNLGLTTAFPGLAPGGILHLMERLQPRLLMSLPLVLSRLGEVHARTGGRPLRDGLLFAGGDVLSKARRGRIESLWGLPLKNFYGLSEVFGPLTSASDSDGVLTWQAEEVFVEILDPLTFRPVEPGETGVAVLTTSWIRPASLVRYWTGDCFRLVGWSAPGRPRFEMRGREQVRLPGLKPAWFPVDIDDALLSDTAVGNEWVLTARPGGMLLTVEASGALDTLDPLTVAGVARMFDGPLDWLAVAPGTLDRSIPKLAVAGLPV